MRDVLLRNGWKAFAEVALSIVGSIGIVYVISLILSRQTENLKTGTVFAEYFAGGQIGLPILSLSGIILMVLLRRGPIHPAISVTLYVIFVLPIAATAFIIGLNPGFNVNTISAGNLSLLWLIYVGMHVLWFIILILEPRLPSAQEAGEEEEDRVNKIKPKASGSA